MWARGEETAILVGIDLDKYWEMSPKRFRKYVKMYVSKEKNRAREIDCNNFNLGKYIGIAFNDPKNYPRKPFLHKKKPKVMTEKEMERMMRRNTIKLGGTLK